MDKNYKVLELIKTIEGLKNKKQKKELNKEIMKPVSEETLDEVIEMEPGILKEIKNCCIIATTGQDMAQMYAAMKQLVNYLPDKHIYVSSIVLNGTRVIMLTTEDLPHGYIIHEMPENIRTYKGEKGIEYFVVQ